MTKPVAVLAVHGIGSQGAKAPTDSATLSFSKAHARLVRNHVGAPKFDPNVAWREGFWADILQSRQETYLRRIKRRTRGDEFRGFVLRNLSDAASYRWTPQNQSADTTYWRIHARIDAALKNLEAEVAPDARLIILAHSLGGHIMSNYIYDRLKKPDPNGSDFFNLKRTMAFVTFGCNIPIFVFAYDPEDVTPIWRPGSALDPKYRLRSWWLNYYDKDDILGFPLRDIGPKYEKMVKDKEIADVSINAGGLFKFWNPLSHNAYWKDADFFTEVAKLINVALR